MIAPSLQPRRFVGPSPSASMKSIAYSVMVSELKGSLVSAVCPCPGRSNATALKCFDSSEICGEKS
jgi:hypothetical protein